MKMFRKLGAHTADLDSIVHEILRVPRIIKRIGALLGDGALSKTHRGLSVSRRRVAEIIFNDPCKRVAVENLIHPVVLRRVKSMMKQSARRDPSSVIVVEVPLLYEAGYERYFDSVAVVYCNRKIALARLLKKGFTGDDVIRRMRAQMPISRKRKAADYVIDNSGVPELTEARVGRIMEKVASTAGP